MKNVGISFNTRKSLENKMGEAAGRELADMIFQLAYRIDQLERNKIDVIPVLSISSTRSLTNGDVSNQPSS